MPGDAPYDQIPEDRRTIGDFTGRIDEHNGVLGVALAQWMARDDSKAEPAIRQAANTAMDEIDAMLRKLLALRSRPAAPRVRRLRDGPGGRRQRMRPGESPHWPYANQLADALLRPGLAHHVPHLTRQNVVCQRRL